MRHCHFLKSTCDIGDPAIMGPNIHITLHHIHHYSTRTHLHVFYIPDPSFIHLMLYDLLLVS